MFSEIHYAGRMIHMQMNPSGLPRWLTVKNSPAMWEVQETRAGSLGEEDPMERGMATIPVFLPKEFHGQKPLSGYSPWGLKESEITEVTEHTHTHTHMNPFMIFQKHKVYRHTMISSYQMFRVWKCLLKREA